MSKTKKNKKIKKEIKKCITIIETVKLEKIIDLQAKRFEFDPYLL